MLNIYGVINGNVSNSPTYMIDFCDLWHDSRTYELLHKENDKF